MKICMGISTTQSLSNPAMGSEHACMGLAQALAMRGHQVDVVNLLWDAPKEGYDIYHWVNAHGTKGPYLAMTRYAKSVGAPCVATPIWWPVTKGEIELVESFFGSADSWLENKGYYNSALASAASEVDYLVPNSEREGEVFAGLLKQEGYDAPPWSVIPNAVDSERINQIETKSWDNRPKRIMCAGRIEPAKNQHNLVSAFAPYRRDLEPSAELMLAGEISHLIIDSMMNLFLQPGINLAGRLPQMQMFEEMANSRVHVLLGVHETPGLVTLEAAALGCQVVVATEEYGTISEYIDKEQLIEVDPLDPYSVQEGIEEAMEVPPDPSLKEKVLKEYSYGKAAETLEGIYLDLVKDKN